MTTKLLYILVSSEKDIYLEQAYVSMLSAKHHMPDVKISLLIDVLTEQTLIGERKRILDLVSETIVKDLPTNLNGQKRSRILKTSCRNLVDGDFLFIDCDTIILSRLDEIDTYPFELAACRDSHSPLISNPYRKMCFNHCQKIGADIRSESDYYNSGVILARDTPKVREFYKTWNSFWIEGAKKGIFMDQPSLAKTNINYNHYIKQLPDIWNCQVIHGIKYLNEAKILHYLCTSPTRSGDQQMFILRDKEKLLAFKGNMNITNEIKKYFDNPFLGIPDCVDVVAGKNINIIRSDSFRFLERINGSLVFTFWDNIFKVFNLFNKAIKRIHQKFRNS